MSGPELSDADREAMAEILNSHIVDHPMWIGDDGEPLDYLPEREARIGEFVNEAVRKLTERFGR